MSAGASIAKQVVHDKLESQIKTAEARLATLRARAVSAKANVEIEAIEELLPRTRTIQQKFQDLKKSGGSQWDQAKSDLEAHVSELENSVKGIESRMKGN